MIITTHAIARYRQRVADVSEQEARAAISSKTVELAADFGAPFVRLGTGQRVVIANGVVVTVLPSDEKVGCLDRRRPLVRTGGFE